MLDSTLATFSFLADINDIFEMQSHFFKNSTFVSEVVHSVECKNYVSPGIMVSLWSETKLKDSRVITLWIDLQPVEADWLLDGRLSWYGDETIFQSQIFRLNNFTEVQLHTKSLLNELHQRVKDLLSISAAM